MKETNNTLTPKVTAESGPPPNVQITTTTEESTAPIQPCSPIPTLISAPISTVDHPTDLPLPVSETDTTPTNAITDHSTIGAVHVDSKRQSRKESKQNKQSHQHPSNGSDSPQPHQPPAKKQKRRVDLVTPEEDLKNAVYFFENGLRKVKPYPFKYQTYAKGRWLGRQLLEIFLTEFRDKDASYYETAIDTGTVKVNGKMVTRDYIVQNSDVIEHEIHRHEPPVTAQPIRIVRQEAGAVIIDKPGSIPVHASGRYRHNTILHILRKEQGFSELFTVNRLDRLTSGLMILAKTAKDANVYETAMKQREIKKEYVCKVLGRFPDGRIECHEPIHIASFKLSLNTVHPDGKACSTIFERLRYDSTTDRSIVHARPITGRTHQIRVHLQYLGYPIANDPLYCNSLIWGPENGRGGLDSEQEKAVVEKLTLLGDADDELDLALATNNVAANRTSALTVTTATTTTESASSASSSSTTTSTSDGYQPSFCEVCGVPSREDPPPEKRIIYLHAWKYQAEDWAYETELPEWASMDNTEAETTATTADETTVVAVDQV